MEEKRIANELIQAINSNSIDILDKNYELFKRKHEKIKKNHIEVLLECLKPEYNLDYQRIAAAFDSKGEH